VVVHQTSVSDARQALPAGEERMKRRLIMLAGVIALTGIGVGVAFATAPSGVRTVDYAATGTIPEAVHFNADAIKLQTKDPADVVTQLITYQPGASSGWHSHVGIVVVTVKDGAVTRYLSDCVGQTFNEGDVFIETGDMGPLVLRNEGAVAAHLAASFVTNPPVPANLRIDQPNPGCSVG
jgi:quercetin dioxygenase-like cupin family protein